MTHQLTSISLACSFDKHCAYFQNGAHGTVAEAFKYIFDLYNHGAGCTGCGSIPTTPSGDIRDGQLTINYVNHPKCGVSKICPGGWNPKTGDYIPFTNPAWDPAGGYHHDGT